MYVVIWRYTVLPADAESFEREYGPGGTWVEFFRRGTGYASTDLLKAESHYLTIDRWTSKADYDKFLDAREAEYEELDARLAKLTETEEKVGEYEGV